MKKVVFIVLILVMALSCNTTKRMTATNETATTSEQDTVKIANEDLEYEIIIIEPGFNVWLQSIAKPEGFYSQQFLENRNLLYVTEWNQRVLNPRQYNPNLYEMQIDYRPNIDYGYEVNYKLYNYFIYFQLQYKQQLTGFIPRI